mmetsp:Transcript_44222/g.109894  ORF Transcript_44222/g.109894 Transcript_44222/m.109894 type:complete len:311 (+) Transcript_44222:1154-2086(+)
MRIEKSSPPSARSCSMYRFESSWKAHARRGRNGWEHSERMSFSLSTWCTCWYSSTCPLLKHFIANGVLDATWTTSCTRPKVPTPSISTTRRSARVIRLSLMCSAAHVRCAACRLSTLSLEPSDAMKRERCSARQPTAVTACTDAWRGSCRSSAASPKYSPTPMLSFTTISSPSCTRVTRTIPERMTKKVSPSSPCVTIFAPGGNSSGSKVETSLSSSVGPMPRKRSICFSTCRVRLRSSSWGSGVSHISRKLSRPRRSTFVALIATTVAVRLASCVSALSPKHAPSPILDSSCVCPSRCCTTTAAPERMT